MVFSKSKGIHVHCNEDKFVVSIIFILKTVKLSYGITRGSSDCSALCVWLKLTELSMVVPIVLLLCVWLKLTE